MKRQEGLRFLIFLASIPVIFFSSLASASAPLPHVKALHLQGNQLSEAIRVPLDFLDAEYYVVTVDQTNADFELRLYDGQLDQVLYTVNFPGYLGLEETMLVSRGNCTECEVIVSPKSPLDSAADYSIRVVPYSARSSKQIEVELTAGNVWALNELTEAGIQYSEIAKSQANSTKILEKVAAKLALIASASERSIDDDLVYTALLRGALIASKLGKNDDAKSMYQSVINKTSNDPSVYRICALFEIAAFDSDNLQERRRYEEGARLAKELGVHSSFARGLNFLSVNLIYDGLYKSAFINLNQAKSIYSKHGNVRGILDVVHNLSWGHLRAGDLSKSISFASEQKLIAEQFRDKEEGIWALYNLGLAYGNLGEALIANQFIDLAIEKLGSLPTENQNRLKSLKSFLLLDKAHRHYQYGDYARAEDYAQQVKQLFTQMGRPNRIADTDFLLAEIAHASQNYDQARQMYLASLDHDLENQRTAKVGQRLLKLSELAVDEGNYIGAAHSIVEAFSRISDTEDKRLTSEALSQAMLILYLLGDIDGAREIAQKASPLIEKYGQAVDLVRFLHRQSLVEEALGEIEVAGETLAKARSKIDEQLKQVQQRYLRQRFLAINKEVYETSIKISLSEADASTEDSLVLVEQFRARTLAEQLNSISHANSVDPSIVTEREETLERIRSGAAAFHSDGYPSTEKQLLEIRRLSAKLEKLESTIIASRKVQPASLSEQMRDQHFQASEDEVIAYYFVGERKSWLWIVTGTNGQAFELPPRHVIEPMVKNYRNVFERPPTDRGKTTAWQQRQMILELSDSLLGPIKRYVENNAISQLTIIPDGPLLELPFSALSLNPDASPLIKDVAISYAPSLRVRKELRQRPSTSVARHERNVLIVADPIITGPLGERLSDLPFSRQEATQIESAFAGNVKVLLGQNAEKHQFLNGVQDHYSVIHFATHGLIDLRVSALSGLLFSGSGDSNNLWLAPEISRTKLHADLVTLSACESAQGEQVAGEGLFSLSRSFIVAGAKRVLGTLWKIEDRSSAELMANFYGALSNDTDNVAQALRTAQIELMTSKENDWSDPYYWASFQLMGG